MIFPEIHEQLSIKINRWKTVLASTKLTEKFIRRRDGKAPSRSQPGRLRALAPHPRARCRYPMTGEGDAAEAVFVSEVFPNAAGVAQHRVPGLQSSTW